MNALRLPRLAIAAVGFIAAVTACQQGATVGPYPYNAATASPTPGGVTASSSPSGGGSASPSGGGSASPSGGGSASPSGGGSASPTATTAAYGKLVISPDPINFSATSVLGDTATATISQTNYTGAFTLPANAVVCSNGVTTIPVTAVISGSTLTVTLGLLGVTGSCLITVDGAPGTSGTETVNLTVPIGQPASSAPLTFSPNPVVFTVLDAVSGSTATSTVSESGYTGAFMLTSSPVSCPFDLVSLAQISASISGDTVTVTAGTLNANILGSCSVTVEDASGNTGALTVNFQL